MFNFENFDVEEMERRFATIMEFYRHFAIGVFLVLIVFWSYMFI